MTIPSDPVERHRAIAAEFAARTEKVADWDAPSPVSDWKARDVVRHLVEWFPSFLEGGTGITLSAVPSVDDDPVAAWREHAANVQALLDEPATADHVLSNPNTGDVPLPEAIDRFYTNDVFMHTWDLSRAAGLDDRLDAEECTRLADGMEPIADMLSGSGQFGQRVMVPDDADGQARMLGIIGRDPSWTR
jgi:uncharacterized protein (TIGR03086 family)